MSMVIVLIALVADGTAGDRRKVHTKNPAPIISYSRLYSDSLGDSHFTEENIQLSGSATPSLSLQSYLSEFKAAKGHYFIYAPSGWSLDWHTAPARQFLLSLRGVGEIEASDGQVRRLAEGSIILVEDTSGRGHISRVIGEEDVLIAVIR
jgi:hypothetical protein